MWMNLLVIAIIALMIYLWTLRGFFSAMLHLLAVVVAGAIAFAVWEPLAYLILEKSPRGGFFSFIESIAWGAALMVPFGVCVILLRVITDKLVGANLTLVKSIDYLGGAVCGLFTGIITAGIVVLGMGMLWVGSSFLGYQRLDWSGSTGGLQRTQKLWVPVDDIVARVYTKLSMTTLQPNPDHALARLYPSLADVPASTRLTIDKGKGRHTIRPSDFSMVKFYTVGVDEAWHPFEGVDLKELNTDTFNITPRDIFDIDGNSLVKPGAYIAGFTIAFKSGAREKDAGQVAITAGQVRLVCSNDDDEMTEVYPIALVTRSDKGAEVDYGRHRFDSQWFTPASLTEAEPRMAFEFAVPAGYRPAAFYLKNIRIDLSGRSPDRRFASQWDRQQAIADGSLTQGSGGALDESNAITINVGTNPGAFGINLASRLPRGMMIQDGNERSLQTNEQRRIVNGTESYTAKSLSKRIIERKMRIDQFAVTRGSAMVQLQITPGRQSANPAVNLAQAPLDQASRIEPLYLVDTNGIKYSCIGYIYKDRTQIQIRYTRSQSLTGLSELPSLPNRSRNDQQITLLFEPTTGARIAGFAIGNELLVKFTPAIEAKNR